MRYMAMLRLSSDKYSYEDKLFAVEEYIEQMKLSKFKDSLVGSVESRGISGGEKKRTDEPTTGLDNKDVITISTIHQPNYKTFCLFDKVLLLSLGGIVYYGAVSDARKYFSELGFNCPEFENPCDFYVRLISVDYNSESGYLKSISRVEKLKQKWTEFSFNQRDSITEIYSFDLSRSPSVIDRMPNDPVHIEDYDSINLLSSADLLDYNENKSKWCNSWTDELVILMKRGWLSRRSKHDWAGFLNNSILDADDSIAATPHPRQRAREDAQGAAAAAVSHIDIHNLVNSNNPSCCLAVAHYHADRNILHR
ncbi:ABC transporter G family member 11 [Smittium culicis]|uniref:ABC transporter G family member 11 n=1 Tax=Smittium culicis TaxID=133412 RepID=A0A1R1XYK1_9FUNG|nr:ABC transporter G family member 11 [Smittium culicis]